MKLHCHSASTTSRPLMMFAAEQGLALDMDMDMDVDVDVELVDLFTGEHLGEGRATVNPNCLVPTLQDGGFRLTESAAIPKYLADKVGSPLCPTNLQARSRANERMDWINTQLCSDLACGTVYPQRFPHHRRPSDEVQHTTVARGRERARQWMQVLDRNLLGPGNAYLCGQPVRIADFYGAAFLHLAEVIGSDLSAYPHVQQWLVRMKARPSWAPVWCAIDGFAAQLPRDGFVAQ